ncbi:hypothetical protein HZQ90_09295 [Elizabethkingia anophelis]|nr:hypothetical protein [Elizabethkingia anophelis]
MEEIIKDTPIKLSKKIPDVQFEKYVIRGKNGAQALQEIIESTALSAFIDDDNNLYCGLVEGTNIGETAIYDLNYNIVSNDLEIMDNSSYKVFVKYTYTSPKGEKTIVTTGDKDGEAKDYKTTIISDPVMLKKLADEAYKNLKKEGLSGSVTSFLIPFATRGMVAEIRDNEHPHLEGNYFIKKVTTTFGMQGARRKIEISNRL